LIEIRKNVITVEEFLLTTGVGMNPNLQARWADLWTRLECVGDAQIEFARLVIRYAEPHRRYHSFDHIEHCLAELDEIRDQLGQPDIDELALWLHDVHLNTRRERNDHLSNEQRSAIYAQELLERAGLSMAEQEMTAARILLTSHSSNLSAQAFDEQAVLDIDLSILGQPWQAFDLYERQVRVEYLDYSDEEFNAGRKSLLQTFLKRDPIFLTEHFRKKYEKQARLNLRRSIKKLS
jgi:predicted metal-dependent HD superfamily phosphohydrolase